MPTIVRISQGLDRLPYMVCENINHVGNNASLMNEKRANSVRPYRHLWGYWGLRDNLQVVTLRKVV